MNAPPFTPTCNAKGFAGQVVAIRYLEDGFLSCFPPAPPAELAGMLRGALSNIVVLVITTITKATSASGQAMTPSG